MAEKPPAAHLSRRDRLLVASGLAGITVISWAYMLNMAWHMAAAGMGMHTPCLRAWGASDLAHIFVMWAIMMVAMMLPSATPMVLVFAAFNRRSAGARATLVPTWLFVLGYLAVWTAYSLLATVAQWGLQSAALLTHAMTIAGLLPGAVLLVVAGVFQWTPLRDACMVQCRFPFSFIVTHWREGRRGAVIMGLQHGANCVGCCWLLMALSFVLGVMNMLWMAVLTAFMVVEKTTQSEWVGRAAGVLLVLWGLLVLVRGLAS